MTHSSGYSNGYQDSSGYDPSIEIHRQFDGIKWQVRTAVHHHMPAWANGRTQFFSIAFGGPGESTILAGAAFHRDSGYGIARIYSYIGDSTKWVDFGNNIADDLYFEYKIKRNENRISIYWRLNEGEWQEGNSRDLGSSLKSTTTQRIIINGSCWYVPGGSYADYNYVSLEPEEATPVNKPPVANAGISATARVEDVVRLDGSGSRDPEGYPLTAKWKFISRPVGSRSEIVGASNLTAQFSPDRTGSYIAQLTVTDNAGASASAAVQITVKENGLPSGPKAIINILNSNVISPTWVLLDGSKSTGVLGIESYRWSLASRPTNSSAIITNSAATARLRVDLPGLYIVSLKVIGSGGKFDTTSVNIYATGDKGNPTPIPPPSPPSCGMTSSDGDYYFACNGKIVSQRVSDASRIFSPVVIGSLVIWTYREPYDFSDWFETYYGNCVVPTGPPSRLSDSIHFPIAKLDSYSIKDGFLDYSVCQLIGYPGGCRPWKRYPLPKCNM